MDKVVLTQDLIDIAIGGALRSDDETKIGAVIVSRTGTPIAYGENRFPRGIQWCPRRGQEEHKHQHTIHAEIIAILNAGKYQKRLQNRTMIIAGKCICHNCANAIIEVGIKKLFCPPPDKNSKWVRSNQQAIDSLREAGVTVEFDDRLIGLEAGLTTIDKYEESAPNLDSELS